MQTIREAAARTFASAGRKHAYKLDPQYVALEREKKEGLLMLTKLRCNLAQLRDPERHDENSTHAHPVGFNSRGPEHAKDDEDVHPLVHEIRQFDKQLRKIRRRCHEHRMLTLEFE